LDIRYFGGLGIDRGRELSNEGWHQANGEQFKAVTKNFLRALGAFAVQSCILQFNL